MFAVDERLGAVQLLQDRAQGTALVLVTNRRSCRCDEVARCFDASVSFRDTDYSRHNGSELKVIIGVGLIVVVVLVVLAISRDR
jgi:hypothetical protein